MQKSFFLRLAGLALVAALALAACSPLPRVLKAAEAGRAVVVEPSPLTAVGETAPFDVTARVPAGHLHKGLAYELLLRYRYEQGMRDDTLGRITFAVGNYTYDENNRQLLVIRQHFAVPNTPGRSPGVLLARPQVRELKPQGRTYQAAADVVLAKGLADPARRAVREDTALALLPESASNVMSGTRVLPFYFDAGTWYIRSALGTNVVALEDLIDANQHTRKVIIKAGHSPDSLDLAVPHLARQRVLSLLHYYKERVRGFSYLNHLENIQFDTLVTEHDWRPFLQKVGESALKPAQQDSVLLLINTTPGSFTDKEVALHRLSFFDYLQDYIYPVLRVGTVAVAYTAPKRYDSEIYLLSKKIVDKQTETDALTPEELRYSATLTPLLAEKQRIYEVAAATTASWQAFFNLAVVLSWRAEKESAPMVIQAYQRRAALNFTLAAHRNPTAELFYRTATAFHDAGDFLEALQNYDYAIKLGGPPALLRKIFADRAALEIQVGQPDEALRSLQYAGPSYQNTMNRALIFVLKEGYELAATQYRAALALRPAAPAPTYGLAVVAARQHDEAAVAQYLTQAVQADRSYAQKAVEDLEFEAYAGSKPFREALK